MEWCSSLTENHRHARLVFLVQSTSFCSKSSENNREGVTFLILLSVLPLSHTLHISIGSVQFK